MKKREIISALLGTMIGGIGGSIAAGSSLSKNVEKWRNMSDKHLELFLLMNEWMKKKQEGRHIKEYFEKNGYISVAIYGLSYIGERLIDELKESGIEVKYAIDKNANSIYSDLEVYLPEDGFPDVDVIVVTAISFFDEIYDLLVGKIDCAIVSLQDILYELS